MRVRIKVLTIAVMVLGIVAASVAPASAQNVVDERTVTAASVFVGTASVTGGIGYPVCTNGTTPPNPPLNPCPSASGQTWTFSANSAVAEEAVVALACGRLITFLLDATTKTVEWKYFCTAGGGSGGDGVGAASISASGTLNNGLAGGAWCGASGGGGSGTATVSGPNVEANVAATLPGGTTSTSTPNTSPRNLTLNSIGWVQSAATLIVATGTATAVGPYAPNPTGEIVTVVSAVPDPLVGTSCTNRTQTKFRVVGTAVAALTS